MSDSPSLPPLRDVIRRHGLEARKGLGQHFLLDLNLTRRIARAAGPLEQTTVVEVGPGPGGLTRALLMEGADRVVAIERDSRCLPALAEISAAWPGRLEVIAGDALKHLHPPGLTGEVRVAANLPYNAATAILTGWLGSPWPPWFRSLTVMVQKEVGARMTAAPGSRVYGRLSVACQWRCRAEWLFGVPARAFTPVPKVDGGVVRLTPVAPSVPTDPPTLEKVTAAAFSQRRKMMRSAMRSLSDDPLSLLAEAGIDPRCRAEELNSSDFCRLANALKESAGSQRKD